MTVPRRTVGQIIARLASQTLRERAQLAGTAQARPDAAQALAALLDVVVPDAATPEQIARICQQAIAYGFASVNVAPQYIAAYATCLDGSRVSIGTTITAMTDLEVALRDGADDITLVLNSDDLDTAKREAIVQQCQAAGARVWLQASAAYDDQALCNLARSIGADGIVINPQADLAALRSMLGADAGLRVPGIETVEQARAALRAGATRLAATDAVALVDAAQHTAAGGT